MDRVTFRFYAELNDFLSPERRMKAFSHALFLPASVKDVIESFGVPHPEVGLILVNSEPVEFTHVVSDGDHVSVYPNFTGINVSALLQLRPQLQEIRFAVDTHLGRLATYLRMLGFDAWYEIGCDDLQLSRISARESRVLLTRDRGLLKLGKITMAILSGRLSLGDSFSRSSDDSICSVLQPRLDDVCAVMCCCNPSPRKRYGIDFRQERRNASTNSRSARAAIAFTGLAPIMNTCSASLKACWPPKM